MSGIKQKNDLLKSNYLSQKSITAHWQTTENVSSTGLSFAPPNIKTALGNWLLKVSETNPAYGETKRVWNFLNISFGMAGNNRGDNFLT